MENLTEKIRTLVYTEVNKIDPNADIYLFGSRARGDSNADSDWDLLILLSHPSVSFETSNALDFNLWTAGMDIGQEINTVVRSRNDWTCQRMTPFKDEVQTDWIKL